MPQEAFDCQITLAPPASPGAPPTFVVQPGSTAIPWGLGPSIVWTLSLGAGCPGTASFSQAGVVLDSRWSQLHPGNPGPVRVSDSVWTLVENDAGDAVDTQGFSFTAAVDYTLDGVTTTYHYPPLGEDENPTTPPSG